MSKNKNRKKVLNTCDKFFWANKTNSQGHMGGEKSNALAVSTNIDCYFLLTLSNQIDESVSQNSRQNLVMGETKIEKTFYLYIFCFLL